jgi:hypothetical protein
MVQLFYNGSESVTRGAKERVLCQMEREADTDQSFAPSSEFALQRVIIGHHHP